MHLCTFTMVHRELMHLCMTLNGHTSATVSNTRFSLPPLDSMHFFCTLWCEKLHTWYTWYTWCISAFMHFHHTTDDIVKPLRSHARTHAHVITWPPPFTVFTYSGPLAEINIMHLTSAETQKYQKGVTFWAHSVFINIPEDLTSTHCRTQSIKQEHHKI